VISRRLTGFELAQIDLLLEQVRRHWCNGRLCAGRTLVRCTRDSRPRTSNRPQVSPPSVFLIIPSKKMFAHLAARQSRPPRLTEVDPQFGDPVEGPKPLILSADPYVSAVVFQIRLRTLRNSTTHRLTRRASRSPKPIRAGFKRSRIVKERDKSCDLREGEAPAEPRIANVPRQNGYPHRLSGSAGASPHCIEHHCWP
jgi:hypothetical protein